MVFVIEGDAPNLAAPTTVQFIGIIAVLSLLLAWIMTKLLSPSLHQSSEAPKGSKRAAARASKQGGDVKGPLRSLTAAEVRAHNKESDCWIVVKGKVYDVTEYVIMHPGGDAILRNAGGDATDGFFGPQHPSAAFDTLEEYAIGSLVE